MGNPLTAMKVSINIVTARRLFNYLAFQLGWFVLVLTQSPWTLIWALLFVLGHGLWLATRAEWRHVLPIMLIGMVIDGLWQASPWVQFYGAGWPLPLWLIGLWLMFPLTLNHSLAWLNHRPVLLVLGGILGAGGSYLGGAALGAAEITGPARILLPLSWGLWLPLCFRFGVVQKKNLGRSI